MRKDVEEHIKKVGRRIVQRPKEPEPCDFARLFDGFLVHVLRLDSEEYRREFWREAYNGHTIGRVPRTFEGFVRRNARSLDKTFALLLSIVVMFGAYAGLVILVDRTSRLVRQIRYKAYYAHECRRRHELAAERRKIRIRYTLNPRPSYEDIRAAHAAARGSPEGALRCGSLMQDLECFVDNSLIMDKAGRIVGRRGGVKRLLQLEAPDLFAKYSTLMRYKAMAKRFRQACGLGDPIPTDMLLGERTTDMLLGERTTDMLLGERTPANPSESMPPVASPLSSEGGTAPAAGAAATSACCGWHGNLPELVPARKMAAEIMGKCEGTIISLEAQLALRLDPDCIPVRGSGGAVVCKHVRGRPRVLKRVVDWLLRRSAA